MAASDKTLCLLIALVPSYSLPCYAPPPLRLALAVGFVPLRANWGRGQGIIVKASGDGSVPLPGF